MVAKLSISNAAAKITEGFRAVVQDAAHNATLTPSERSHIASAWLKKTIPAKTIQVSDAVDGYIAPKVKSALYSVSSNKTSVTEADVQKLIVTELRVAADALFTPSAKVKKLQSALDALDVPQLTDYGKQIGLDKFAPDTMANVMEKITGTEFDLSYGWDQTMGLSGVKGFAGSMHQVGKNVKQSEDDDPTPGGLSGSELKARYDAVADAVFGAFKPADFLSVRHLSHAIQEDGDTRYSILLGEKKDHTWVAVTYSDFPY